MQLLRCGLEALARALPVALQMASPVDGVAANLGARQPFEQSQSPTQQLLRAPQKLLQRHWRSSGVSQFQLQTVGVAADFGFATRTQERAVVRATARKQ